MRTTEHHHIIACIGPTLPRWIALCGRRIAATKCAAATDPTNRPQQLGIGRLAPQRPSTYKHATTRPAREKGPSANPQPLLQSRAENQEPREVPPSAGASKRPVDRGTAKKRLRMEAVLLYERKLPCSGLSKSGLLRQL